MEHLDSDAVAIWSYMQHHEKELWRKRKFLMGLSELDCFDQNVTSHTGNQSILPESFLRKDDVFYENVTNFVEKGFGACNTNTAQRLSYDGMDFCDLHNMSRMISILLDDLSNIGLYRLAKIIARGSVTFDKTRSQMKKFIKRSLPDIQSNQCHRNYQVEIQNQISQLLTNPRNFHQNHLKHLKLTMKSHHGAVMKIVEGLEDLSSQTLSVMHRKLRGILGSVPQLHPPRCGWNRDCLVDRVRTLCLDMVDQLGESDKLQEPLAKAMEVAGLSSKLASGNHDLSVARFVHVTPDLEALQNEIVKAIRSLGQRIRREEIKSLQHILDPESKVDDKGLKTAIRKMFTEFLFECSDMDAIPHYLLKALSIINKTSNFSRRFIARDIIEEEVECILNVGAHIKQILWDRVPDDNLDEDFTDAYMEELEESDDGDIFDAEQQLNTNTLDEVHIRFNDFSEEVESTGDPGEAMFSSPPSTCKSHSKNSNDNASSSSFGAARRVDDVEGMKSEISGGKMNPSEDDCYSSILFSKKNPTSENQNTARNQYVALQEVCDEASVVAYQLIGHVLDDFAQMEALDLDWDDKLYLKGEYSGPDHFQDPVANSTEDDVSGSIIVQAVHKVIPSFSNSELEIVKKFMSS